MQIDQDLLSKVFVPQCPMRLDPLTGNRVASINLGPAASYGKLVELCRPRVPMDKHELNTSLQLIERGLECSEVTDYIVACGDPILIAAAIHYQTKRHGKAVVLRWDRNTRSYTDLEVML